MARLRLAGAAVAGAVVGHALTYLLTVPDPRARARVLAETGHGYWAAAVAAAAVLGAAAAGATILGHLRLGLRGQRPARRTLPRLARLAGALAGLQVAIYTVQEVVERLAAHAPLGELLRHRLLAGVLVQLVVAAAVGALLGWLGRAAQQVGWTLGQAAAWCPADGPLGRPTCPPPRSRRAVGRLGSRAPPAVGALSA
jgi:hypothetical protein